MTQSFRHFLTIRIGALICILVAASFGLSLYQAETIRGDVRAEQADVLDKALSQKLEKKRDVGVTNAISIASGNNLATLVSEDDKPGAEAELNRIGDVFSTQSNYQGIRIQLFGTDHKTFLRNWKPDQSGDVSAPLVPLLDKVSSTGKAQAGFTVDRDGVFLRGTAPLSIDGRTIGFLQFIQGMGSISRDFEKEGVLYALLVTPEAAEAAPSLSDAPRYGGLVLSSTSWFSETVREGLDAVDMQRLVDSGEIIDGGFFATAIPLDDLNGKRIGYHVLLKPESVVAAKVSKATVTALTFIGLMSLGFILVGGIVLFMLNRTLLRPMHRLAEYAQGVSDGKMDEAFTTDARFELKTLADSIMEMIAGLREQTAQAQAQAEEARHKGREAREALDKASREEQRISELFESLKEASAKAEDISHKALGAVNDLSGEVDLVARGVEVQRDRMMETATAMEEMNSTVAEVARNASHAAVNASTSRKRRPPARTACAARSRPSATSSPAS